MVWQCHAIETIRTWAIAGLSARCDIVGNKKGRTNYLRGLDGHLYHYAATLNATTSPIYPTREHWAAYLTNMGSKRTRLRSIIAGSIRCGDRLFHAGIVGSDSCKRCANARREATHENGTTMLFDKLLCSCWQMKTSKKQRTLFGYRDLYYDNTEVERSAEATDTRSTQQIPAPKKQEDVPRETTDTIFHECEHFHAIRKPFRAAIAEHIKQLSKANPDIVDEVERYMTLPSFLHTGTLPEDVELWRKFRDLEDGDQYDDNQRKYDGPITEKATKQTTVAGGGWHLAQACAYGWVGFLPT